MTAAWALPRHARHADGPDGRRLPGLLQAMDLDAHLGAYGPPPYRGPRQLIEVVAAVGLTGRGGAGFPTARKLAAVAEAGRRAVAVGNGAESEPASRKDKQLLRTAPHLVLDGLQLAAEAVGATTAYLYLHRHPGLHRALGSALAARAAAGLDRVEVQLVSAPRFLAGEESAVVSRINSGPALPRFKVPPTFQRGVAGAPTLVQNVETLAHVAQIARGGASWFRAAGTAEEPGSMLATCRRADGTVEVAETAIGTPLGELLRLAELPGQAVLVGGYHGTWLTSADAAALPLANAGLRPAGAAVGAGLLAALPPGRCGIAEAVRVVRYLAAESAGQCGPAVGRVPGQDDRRLITGA
jgi:NADH:ubiquinone oxidoreductase subunit F (NADH-binding)